MDAMREFILEDIRLEMSKTNQIESFICKIISVFLAEGVSNTVYQILTVIMAGDGKLDPDQALLARSIYAVFISLYSPIMGWLIAKSSWSKGNGFFGIILQTHAKILPVLLAWGWKDWASQLDTWAGAELWDEFVVAAVLTLIVVVLQSVPCFARMKAAVAAGGDGDTLLARLAIIPASLALTLGYVWNMVASYFVGKVQDLHAVNANGETAYAYKFAIQGIYALVISLLITVVSVLLVKNFQPPAKKEPAEDNDPHEKATLDDLSDWEGKSFNTLVSLSISSMSFIYGWACLDTMDDWAFGVMFHCKSYSACSYQANFCYSMCVTVFFVYGAMMIKRWEDFESDSPMLTKAISLQLNAMILTVGWAWMNFYTVWMDAATADAGGGMTILIYVVALKLIFIVTSLVMFVMQRLKLGLQRYHRQCITSLKALPAKQTVQSV